jgi:hypothetical protein
VIELMVGGFTVKAFPPDGPAGVVTFTVTAPATRPSGTVHLMLVFVHEVITA